MVAILYFVFMYICTDYLLQYIDVQCADYSFVDKILMNRLVFF